MNNTFLDSSIQNYNDIINDITLNQDLISQPEQNLYIVI